MARGDSGSAALFAGILAVAFIAGVAAHAWYSGTSFSPATTFKQTTLYSTPGFDGTGEYRHVSLGSSECGGPIANADLYVYYKTPNGLPITQVDAKLDCRTPAG